VIEFIILSETFLEILLRSIVAEDEGVLQLPNSINFKSIQVDIL
jgi:hypothetical protein